MLTLEFTITDQISVFHRHMLQDTKSLDGKTTLLSYIARQLNSRQPPAALLAQEMPHVVGPALKISLQASLFFLLPFTGSASQSVYMMLACTLGPT